MTNKVNQIQNYVPPIAWVVMTGEDKGIVEYVTDGFDAPTNIDNISTHNKHCFLQGIIYIYIYIYNTNYFTLLFVI